MNKEQILQPRKALNKAYLKVKPTRTEIEKFKENLIELIDTSNKEESEEYHKNLVSAFLKKTYYDPKFFINTKGRNDLVIHNGDKPKSTVGVIIEAKRPTNASEMLSKKDINKKALQELLLYYMRERITQQNLEIRYLIATNINEWFVFDAQEFEKHFAQNKELVKKFKEFEAGTLSSAKNDLFYNEIAKPAIAKAENKIEFTYFDIPSYDKSLRNNDPKDDNKLIVLFKLLSPEHLLKLAFENDSNALDKRFYTELLHLIGLEEVKEKSKKLIGRKKEKERNSGSLLETAINEIHSVEKVYRLDNKEAYGSTYEEQLFNVGLELCITWINRILFLKLLEAQLLTYHKNDESYKFLDLSKIKSFDDLNTLFFKVLARRKEKRIEEVKELFSKVPYLNSSLFEPTEIEHNTIFIGNLRDNKEIPIHPSTVLKDDKGKKRTGRLNLLEYLFEFLNAYDFSSEGSEEIQEDNKTLINASVLGLIFEKINGYKDGSFFTPGFITMYMCRETIRKAVVQKFNEAKKWKCKSIEELYNKIDVENRQEANEIVNSIKICDPAVGSGHFLVSALNEMIAVKNDLKILQDRNGKRLKEYHVEVVNDELIVTDEEGELYEYNPLNKESQRVQEALFHEKQTIIENCLFGVDINPNSVKICRLRLWIELLKSAYYKSKDELETLPNIDINIKCGNSLISRFDLNTDLSEVLKKNKIKITDYRNAVNTYRNAQNKEQKREMERYIDEIKNNFRSEIARNDPKIKRLSKLKGDLVNLTKQTNLFQMSKKEKSDLKKEETKLTKDINKLEEEIENIKNNKIYINAFEWRFEFPEVLDDKGIFVGFDVVIGNPPYIRVQELPYEAIDYYKSNFQVAYKRIDISVLFSELGYNLLNHQGHLTYITSNQFLKAEYGREARKFLIGKLSVNVDYSKVSVFDGLATYVSIIELTKNSFDSVKYKSIENTTETPKDFIKFDCTSLSEEPWDFNINQDLIKKLYYEHLTLEQISNFTYGVITGFDSAFLISVDEVKNLDLELEITKNFIRPQNYKKYIINSQTYSLIYPYTGDNEIIDEETLENEYPNCYSFLISHKEKLENRKDSRVTIKEKGIPWYSIMRRVDLKDIDCPKIIFYDVGMEPNFTLDEYNNIFGGGTSHSLRIVNDAYPLKYVLGVLNSSLMKWIIYDICPVKMGDARKYGLNYIKKLPIPKASQKVQERIIELVENIMDEKARNGSTKQLENQINQMVYQLYGLTEEEIAVVEKSIK